MDTLYEPSGALPPPTSLLQDNEEEDDCRNDGVGIKGKPKSSSTKRNACTLCRRRKLRCDGASPACGTCTRLNHECIYNESRRKSGPRRGYVKGLETRLGSCCTIGLELHFSFAILTVSVLNSSGGRAFEEARSW